MIFEEYEPYSKEKNGEIIDYLIERERGGASNLFFDYKDYFLLKEKNLLYPNTTCIRISNNIIPDISYLVNLEYLLESFGKENHNMSCIEDKKGIYNPKEILKNRNWSVSGLNYKNLLKTK